MVVYVFLDMILSLWLYWHLFVTLVVDQDKVVLLSTPTKCPNPLVSIELKSLGSSDTGRGGEKNDPVLIHDQSDK